MALSNLVPLGQHNIPRILLAKKEAYSNCPLGTKMRQSISKLREAVENDERCIN